MSHLSSELLRSDQDLADTVGRLMQSRRTTLPKRLIAPGPNPLHLRQILEAAASAPDHGQLRPWRLITIPNHARTALGQAFGIALLERDPVATSDQVSRAQEKALRAPCLMLVVVDSECGDPGIDLNERVVSAGCAVQNLLLMATALGYGSGLTSGKAMKSSALRAIFDLNDGEHALCFINLGTVQSLKNSVRQRPRLEEYVSVWVKKQ